jgi:protein-L-isoaspartate(D-aspartate) O-methyltransferase
MTGAERADDVAAAMAGLDRRAFLPPDQRAHADEDRPLPLGLGQTCSQPSTVAAMLRLLAVPPGARVLDVGAGSGWTTALLGRLVGPAGRVLGVELEPELAVRAAAAVAACGMPWAQVRVARPGVLGWPEDGGYDRILCSASPRHLPDELVDQLADGGRLVLPVGTQMVVVERHGDRYERTAHGSYRFVPLRDHPVATDGAADDASH